MEISFSNRLENLDSMGDELEGRYAQKRGRQFEELVCDVFEYHNLLTRRSYHTEDDKSQQIDGAIEFAGRHALIETKWVSSNLAASTLYAFIGKIDTKFTGTIGIFISRSKLTDNFLNAISYGRKRNVLIIHDEDIPFLMNPHFELEEYLNDYLRHLSIDNIVHFPASTFFRKSAIEKGAKTLNKKLTGHQELIEKCLNENKISKIMNEEVAKLSGPERIQCTIAILNDYADFLPHGLSSYNLWQCDNFQACITELVKQTKSEFVESDKVFFIDHLSVGFDDMKFLALISIFDCRFSYLPIEEKVIFEERLLRNWDEAIGEYSRENDLAPITKLLWEYFTYKTKTTILKHAISFICSTGRYNGYPQMHMAKALLAIEKNSNELKDALNALLHEDFKTWEKFRITDITDINTFSKSKISEYKNIKDYLANYSEFINKCVNEITNKK